MEFAQYQQAMVTGMLADLRGGVVGMRTKGHAQRQQQRRGPAEDRMHPCAFLSFGSGTAMATQQPRFK